MSYLLVTDLDNTLVGDNASLQQFNQLTRELRNRGVLKLAYATGRSLESFGELKKSQPFLDMPDALISSVGTEIYLNGTQRVPNWPHISNWDVIGLQSLLAHIPALKIQPPTGQRQFKLGYFLEENPEILQMVKAALAEHPVEVVYGPDIYLDILPKGAHKGGSATFLSGVLGIDAKNIIACGDSGNDISMLEMHKGIVVGNAQTELLNWLDTAKSTTTYVAKNHYASGVIEGLRHYGVI